MVTIHESISEGGRRSVTKSVRGGSVFAMDLCRGVLHEFLMDLLLIFLIEDMSFYFPLRNMVFVYLLSFSD